MLQYYFLKLKITKFLGVSLFILIFSANSWSQELNNVTGQVIEESSNDPLPYTNVLIKGTDFGTITNADGYFSFRTLEVFDTLVISFVGYEKKQIPAILLESQSQIKLQQIDNGLQEILIFDDKSFIYDYLAECRKQIRKNTKSFESKVYFSLETNVGKEPLELLECYYNGYFIGEKIDVLKLKNGRIGLKDHDQRYFVNLSTSKAMSQIQLTKNQDFFPLFILQCSKSKMKRNFDVNMFKSDSSVYHIFYEPYHKSPYHFEGEIWIDKKTMLPIDIKLEVDNTKKHPFLPIFKNDTINNISLQIQQKLDVKNGFIRLQQIKFNYQVDYTFSKRNGHISNDYGSNIFKTKGVLYAYDYDEPFILPFYDYDNTLGDYRKISFIPYNEVFWESTKKLVLTERQKNKIGYFNTYGDIINFNEEVQVSDSGFIKPNEDFFQSNNVFWSDDKRITIANDVSDTKLYSQEEINDHFRINAYNFDVQILLDITKLDSGLDYKAYTVFNFYSSFYHLPVTKKSNVFLNLYFDLCEIERRKLIEKIANSEQLTVRYLEDLHQEAMEAIQNITAKYIGETDSGTNVSALLKWNNYVLERLKIDNFGLFQMNDESTK